MKRYKHRKDGHVVEAELHGSTQGPAYYYVKDYCESHDSFIPIEDFEALFEPVVEYCCDWFRKCIRNRIIRKSTVSGQQEWVWDALDEWFTECPFCKTKL